MRVDYQKLSKLILGKNPPCKVSINVSSELIIAQLNAQNGGSDDFCAYCLVDDAVAAMPVEVLMHGVAEYACSGCGDDSVAEFSDPRITIEAFKQWVCDKYPEAMIGA